VALPDEDEGEDSSTDEPDDAGNQQEP
jgi:hypothetical protein